MFRNIPMGEGAIDLLPIPVNELDEETGAPLVPGLYLAQVTLRDGQRMTIAPTVSVDGAGNLVYSDGDRTRIARAIATGTIQWAYRVTTVPGGALSGGGATDGEAGGVLGADLAEPSTLGREGDWWTRVQVTRAELALLLGDRDALRARVAELEAGRRWIPVSERLPEYGKNVLIWAPKWLVSTEGYRTIENAFIIADGEEIRHDITHWRPVPVGPEVQP